MTDPKTGRLREVARMLPDVEDADRARVWLSEELTKIREGREPRTTRRMRFKDWQRFATCLGGGLLG